MPEIVVCGKCREVLFVGKGATLKTPQEIIEEYDGKCPNCGKKLSSKEFEIEVKPVPKRKGV